MANPLKFRVTTTALQGVFFWSFEMSSLVKFAAPTGTMSSLEIAELVEKRHDNVKRTIETLAASGVILRPRFEDEQSTDVMGRPRDTSVFTFMGEKGRRDSTIVVAQLCPEFTARIIDRWQELEITLKEQAKELALREGYDVNAVNFNLIKVIGKEAALFTELTRDAMLRAEEEFKKLNLPPHKSQKYLNDIYNHKLKRVYAQVRQEEAHQRKLEVQQREIEAHNHKVWMAERKGLLNKSKHEAAEAALRLKMEKRRYLELNNLRLTAKH